MKLMFKDTEVYSITNEEILHKGLCPGIILHGNGGKKVFINWLKQRRTHGVPGMDDKAWFNLDQETLAQSVFDFYWLWNEEGTKPTFASIRSKAKFESYLGELDHFDYDKELILYENPAINRAFLQFVSETINPNLVPVITEGRGIYQYKNLLSDSYFFEKASHCIEVLGLKTRNPNLIYEAIRTNISPNIALDLALVDSLVGYFDRTPHETYFIRDSNTGKLKGLAPVAFFRGLSQSPTDTMEQRLSGLSLEDVLDCVDPTDEELESWLKSHGWSLQNKSGKDVFSAIMITQQVASRADHSA